eukprot:4609628-Prymnesium_polylepis.1
MMFDLSCRMMATMRDCASIKWPRLRSFHHSSMVARTAPVYAPVPSPLVPGSHSCLMWRPSCDTRMQ